MAIVHVAATGSLTLATSRKLIHAREMAKKCKGNDYSDDKWEDLLAIILHLSQWWGYWCIVWRLQGDKNSCVWKLEVAKWKSHGFPPHRALFYLSRPTGSFFLWLPLNKLFLLLFVSLCHNFDIIYSWQINDWCQVINYLQQERAMARVMRCAMARAMARVTMRVTALARERIWK